MKTLNQVFTAEQNAYRARQNQAQEALKRFATRYPKLRILVWTAQNEVIFAEFQDSSNGICGRANLNYEGKIINRL